ncbi:MAG: CoA-binding protein [Actinobacteria bacterium]|nr:CoA-binding protein [Actinomycetota bacterium]
MGAASVVEQTAAERFLDGGRIVLVGASDDPKSFSSTIAKELTARGCDVVPVNPGRSEVAGRRCYPDVGSVPGPVDRVLVMVPAEPALDVVRDCIRAGVQQIWLFRGVGGPGATSPQASDLCREAGADVIDGACPLMFLAPVGWFHRMHRTVRRVRGSVVT